MVAPSRSPAALSAPAEGPEARRRILDAAAALFLERGYAGTSLREIAAEVGMKTGSLYYHFASKDALLQAILQQGIEVMVEAFHEAERAAATADARARFAAHVRAHLAALFEHGPYTAAHVTTFRTAPRSVCASIVPRRDAYEAMWSALLDELKSAGEVAADLPTGLSRLTLFGAMNSAVEWFDPARGSLDDFADAIVRQFWTGLRGDLR